MNCWSWKPGFETLYKADAQKVGDEILAIGETATPTQIVEKAKNPETELHRCFEWNDTQAAEKYRIEQARGVVRCLVIKQEAPENEANTPPIRLFHRSESDGGYKSIYLIVQHEDEYQELLKRAYADLQSFKKKYSGLSELEEILALID